MAARTSLFVASMASLAKAAQPGAAEPVAAPMRDLQWGQLNFLHTTDTHGWHGGHLQEPQYSADWGDYVSFAEHLRARADNDGIDLLLVDTGDRVEGNGLYDASHPKGEYTYDIFREQDIDIICTGNHELYLADTADREHTKTVPNFKENYIASNLDYIIPETGEQVPMAQRYRRFTTKNQGINIVAMGFLFDFTGNANNTVVQPIEETIKEDWFFEAVSVRRETDLFVVIGHVGVRMEEFKTIYKAIRSKNWFTPIAFFGGHHHIRDSTTYDSRAFALASGRYFETIGWMGIDGLLPRSQTNEVHFHRRYIDNNLFGMHYHTGLNETTFPTEHGKAVSKMISHARKELDLDYRFGCAPKSLWMTRTPFPSNDSIFTWLQDEVLPDVVVREDRKDKSRLAIINTGAIRFDIFEGAFTRDTTYTVSPFLSGLNYIPDVPYAIASKLLKLLNNGGTIFEGAAADAKFMAIPEQLSIQEDIIHSEPEIFPSFADSGGQKPLSDQNRKSEPDLIGGYTTKDDVSNEGDDTVHAPIDFYTVPNCIQAEINLPAEGDPETVDLVFVDFIQSWVLLALRFSGGDYDEQHVEKYVEESFSQLMTGWIQENWKGEC